MTLLRGLSLVAAVSLLTASPVAAQRTIFNPALSLYIFYSDDVEFGPEQVSDTYYRLEVELPVRREFARGAFEFSFAPFLVRYDQSEVFDHDGHRTRATLEFEPSELSALELSGRLQRTQDRGSARDLEDPEAFLTSRLSRDLEAASFEYRRRTTGPWSWDVAGLFASTSFEAVGEAADGDPEAPEGREDLSVEVGGYRALSERTNVGLRYGRRRYDLEVSGAETLDLVSLFLERQLNRRWELELLAGGYNRSGRPAEDVDLTTSGPQGTVTLIRTYRRAALTAMAGNLLTSGGELPSTAELRTVEVLLRDAGLRPGGWHLAARYIHRVPSASNLPTTDLTTLSGAVEWAFHRLIGLRFDGFYADQRGEAQFEGSYYRVGAAIVFHPLGRTRLGGAGGEATGDE